MYELRRFAKRIIPQRHHDAVRVLAYRAMNYGRRRYCPCCDSHVRRFGRFGVIPRPDALCPVCGSLERHRATALFLNANKDLLRRARRILHVSPELSIERMLQASDAQYVTIDLGERGAMVEADMTSMPFADDSFDGIYCGHVLEHIPQDTRAIAEMYRVLQPNGWAIVQVPVKRDTTFEDPSIEDPEVRQRLFGQPDHVRVYGLDFRDRLAEAGFDVSVERPHADMPGDTVARLGLGSGDEIFFCRNAWPQAPKAAA